MTNQKEDVNYTCNEIQLCTAQNDRRQKIMSNLFKDAANITDGL